MSIEPTMRTERAESLSNVAVCPIRASVMGPVAVKPPVAGSYNSADASAAPLAPPAISTLSLASKVAAWPERGAVMDALRTVNEPIVGAGFTVRVTAAVAVTGGKDESVTVTETGYVPAVVGIPDNCPDALSIRPGGMGPDSFQANDGVPPAAWNE